MLTFFNKNLKTLANKMNYSQLCKTINKMTKNFKEILQFQIEGTTPIIKMAIKLYRQARMI